MAALAERVQPFLKTDNFLADSWHRQTQDAYDPWKHPEGIINMGTSENKLVFDLIQEKIAAVDLQEIPEGHTHYCAFTGMRQFREKLGKFMDRYMKTVEPIDPDNISVMVGVGAVVEALAFSLFDQGDSVLIPAPFYGSFNADFSSRPKVKPIPVPLSSEPCKEYGESEPYELSVQRVIKTYEESIAKGIKVKGLLLVNPNNPLGSVYSEELIRQCMDFCHRHQLHIIIDEVYMFCNFGNNAADKLTCALSMKNIPDPQRTHVLWGFSKDFSLSGFRCGLVHSWNRDLNTVLKKSCYFVSVPTNTQYLLESLIDDFDWLDNRYFPEYQKRLRDVQEYARNEFKKASIFCLPAETGLYLWVDFRKYLQSQTFEAEKELFEEFFRHRVYISPCQGFYGSEPGWFRIIISMDMDTLKRGLERIFLTVQQIQGELANGFKDDDLGSLVVQFQKKVRDSSWLDENTAEKWQTENPDLARQFLAELDKCS